MGDPGPVGGDTDSDDAGFDEGDIEEVIELEGPEADDALADEMDEIDLGNHGDSNQGDEGAEGDMEMMTDDADVVFSKHIGSVFCIGLDRTTESLAVTGGEDDKAYVWRLADGEVLMECGGHKDSVTCACFSHNSALVATGDMGGLVKAWDVNSREQVWEFEVSDLEWLDWHMAAPVLLAGTVDGDVWMWKVPSGDCKTFQGHGCQSTAGKVMPDGKRLSVGYEDGAVKVWDLKQGAALHTFSGHQGHAGAVTCLDCHHDNVLVMSGATDGTARIWNSAAGKCVSGYTAGPETGSDEDTNSVEAVGLSRSQPLAAVGSLNGTLGVWDIPTGVQRHKCSHPGGIVRLQWVESGYLLYTSCLDGVTRIWDSRTGATVQQLTGHAEEILDMAVSRDGNIVLTSSGDNTARVFNLQKPER
ncbi:PREDICTED: angio-associated migratory cell protein-like [Branchiostoma belcheri]|uniref:Angio-associated migratory cell protein n=1 Tax=Branchiostoma belcheri TaxID=7741 RepID=A0A6P4XCH1_BRABE|nr:PREDICTED: angio-associated migratory cell protein-like [Branchiostoma belcheri]XP_019614225.1 PREDICTED: angio-associated migratory cell protein-like [Branchiostoma belcheri]